MDKESIRIFISGYRKSSQKKITGNAKDSSSGAFRSDSQVLLVGATQGLWPSHNQKASLRAADSRAMPSPVLHLSTNGYLMLCLSPYLTQSQTQVLPKYIWFVVLAGNSLGNMICVFSVRFRKTYQKAVMGCWVSQSIISATFKSDRI